MLMPPIDRPLLLALVLLAAPWTSACGNDRIEVAPGGPGDVVAVGSGDPGSGGAPSGGGGGDEGGGGAASAAGGSDGDGGAGSGGEVSWDTCETPAACLGDEPSVCPENACESDSIFFTCPGSAEPIPAYVACLVAADLFRDNVWGRVVDCLRAASPDEQCATGPAVVDACLAAATGDACPNPAAEATCAAAAAACADDDTFPIAACEADLRPFGVEGLARYQGCLEDRAAVPCASRHATCIAEVATF